MADKFIGPSPRRGGLIAIAITLLILLVGARYIASALIEYEWWNEIHQVSTWWSLLLYGTIPVAIAVVLFFAVFVTAFFAGLRQTRDSFREGRSISLIKKIAIAALALLSLVVANAMVDNWTAVRYFGGQRLAISAAEYRDPIFQKPLHFYFFELPFLNMLLGVLLAAAVFALLIYWLAAHADRFGGRFTGAMAFDFEPISILRAFDSAFVRLAAALLLTGIAGKIYLARYGLLQEDHTFLVGVDWVADHVILPLQWLLILGCVCAAALIAMRKPRWALVFLLLLPVRWLLPPLIAGLYVHPNELALEKPYIRYHIDATRSAYGLDTRVTEKSFDTSAEVAIDYSRHKALLDNVRLWDWRAFHDTISQIQPLRPYTYRDTDVDRYTIDGQLRQVLIAPRELEVDQLGEAGTRWPNRHLMYTHGYGVVMAEANRITSTGFPVLIIKDAPPEIATKSLKLTEPEIYYSEIAHEPVFVDTAQSEFNYPSGAQTVQTTYHGAGGIPVGSLFMRLAAAAHYGDFNIILTEYLNSKSRMMIHRAIDERLNTVAGFVNWDSDPYLVLTDSGRLVWMADGYMSSDSHPYSREVALRNADVSGMNYMRNSIKATIDAYSGETNLYIFDESDVLIQAYNRLLPSLFKPRSAMPADLRAHARYPEMLFTVQAQMYRTFHMRAPEDFYNRSDAWDFAKTPNSNGAGTTSVSPTYVVAALPGSTTAEFMLITTFTPANKDNLIGVMYARCDGEHLGELIFAQLAKQSIIYGPMQIDARINQDQVISKDITLWDQRGSQVLRGQTLVLPVDNSFLYVAPIYIQSSQTSMPQLKKVALAMGNKLAYADTYEQALAQLIDQVGGKSGGAPAPLSEGTTAPANVPVPSTSATDTLQQIRNHLERYRELSSQGKWAEAGKELDEIQRLVR